MRTLAAYRQEIALPVEQHRGRPVKVREVGRELGVQYVLEGTVRKAEGRVRITAQLIDATTGFHRWSERYERELSNIFALQS